MRIEAISAQNYMAIESARIDFTMGDIYVVSGGNGVGKTTLSETLRNILYDSLPGKPLKDGEMAGFFRTKLSTGETIHWKFDEEGRVLTIKDPRGKEMGKATARAFLRRMAGESKKPFDMDAFLRETQPKKQRQAILQLVNLNLDEHDAAVKDAVEARKDANRRVKDQQARIEDYDPVLAGEEILDATTLANRLTAMTQHNGEYERKNAQCEGLQARIDSANREREQLEEQLRKLNASIVEMGNEHSALLSELAEDAQPYTQEEMDQVRSDVRNCETKNEKIRHAKRMQEEEQALENYRLEATEADAEVKRAEQARMDVVRDADLPGGLDFDPNGDGLLLNGQPLEQACASEVTICALQIKFRELGQLRFIAFDGSHLDYENTMKVLKWMQENGVQGIIEIAERSRERLGLTITVADVYYGAEGGEK